jgi:hypothetical protein
MPYLILTLIFCGFIAVMFTLAVGSVRTRMLVFAPVALLPPFLLLFGFLLPFEESLLFFFLPSVIVVTSGIFTLVGIALLLSPGLNRWQRRYFLIATAVACSPVLMLIFRGAVREV